MLRYTKCAKLYQELNLYVAPKLNQDAFEEAVIAYIRELLPLFEAREQRLIRYYYGIDCDDKTHDQIARAEGIPLPYVTSKLKAVVSKLKQTFHAEA